MIYDWRHYLAVIQRKPGALSNRAPFTEMPDAFRRLPDHLLRKEGGDREMVDILSLVLHHDEVAVLRAVELALEAGVSTKTHILNLLHRLIERKQTDLPEVDPPDALALEMVPKANVDRYDDLRQAKEKRHDPAGSSIVIMLRSLKLHGMAQAVDDLVAQGTPAFEAATPILFQLLKAEMAECEVRSIAYHTKVARFPSYKDFTGFDFKSSDINETIVRQLHRGEFMKTAENVVLIGGPGTGKSHIATAIDVQAIQHHRCKVRFFSTVELVNALEQEKAAGKVGKMAEMPSKTDVVILDGWGTCHSARPAARYSSSS